uniref:Uncharacterized protein n=1 Tax=Anopheles funestus TaxID=62324 RepID=A0A4Y0BIC7_ANOFN
MNILHCLLLVLVLAGIMYGGSSAASVGANLVRERRNPFLSFPGGGFGVGDSPSNATKDTINVVLLMLTPTSPSNDVLINKCGTHSFYLPELLFLYISFSACFSSRHPQRPLLAPMSYCDLSARKAACL